LTISDPESGFFSTPNEQKSAIYALSFLFFMWGFLSCLNDLLVPYLRGVFSLTYTQAMMVQFSFYSAFFLFAIPLGFVVDKLGYKKGIILGLTIASLGCLFFYPAAQLVAYSVFLFALFVLAIGICCLQVAANPYVVLLGPEHTASRRLNLTQGFNSLGTTVAPYFAAIFIFSTMAEVTSGVDAVKLPYVFIAGTLVALALVFSRLKLPQVMSAAVSQASIAEGKRKPVTSPRQVVSMLSSNRPLLLGAVGIFFYVGVEVSVGSLLVNFIADPAIGNMTIVQASQFVTLFWVAAMIGRFIGFILMAWIRPSRLLLFNALAACFLIASAVLSKGHWAMWSILMVGLCNSIMFPTIFSLAIAKMGAFASHGSGILCLAIVGGAVIPIFQGALADTIGLQNSFGLNLVGYLYIAWYACQNFGVQDD
jgi:FHS family L-fucose permease-like MFS transporter